MPVFMLLFCCVLTVTGCNNSENKYTKLPDTPSVTIAGHTWKVDLAITVEEQYRGLSGRSSLERDRGMLFVYDDADTRSFCMRDCDHPLDAIFIGYDMRVINVCQMEVEKDGGGNKSYQSTGPAMWVLEIAGGMANELGIKSGDKVLLENIPLYTAGS